MKMQVSKLKVDKRQDNPYFYFKNESGNIEIWVMKWADFAGKCEKETKVYVKYS